MLFSFITVVLLGTCAIGISAKDLYISFTPEGSTSTTTRKFAETEVFDVDCTASERNGLVIYWGTFASQFGPVFDIGDWANAKGRWQLGDGKTIYGRKELLVSNDTYSLETKPANDPRLCIGTFQKVKKQQLLRGFGEGEHQFYVSWKKE